MYDNLLYENPGGHEKKELNKEKIIELLNGDDDNGLFLTSQKFRFNKYRNAVYIRGVIDISNYCSCQCPFCGNSANSKVLRYRMSTEDVIQCIKQAQSDGIDIIHLASGSDPMVDIKYLEPILLYCLDQDLEVELAVGIKSKSFYQMLIDLGVKRIITKFESSSPEIFAKEKKCGIAYNDFIDHIRGLIAFGFEVGTGNIIGLPGQGVGDIYKDVELIWELSPNMISTSVFIPNQESNYYNKKAGDRLIALRFLAIMNILSSNKKISIPTNSTLGAQAKYYALNIASNMLSVNYTQAAYERNYSIYSGGGRYRSSLQETEKLISINGLKRISFREFSHEL